MRAPGVPGGREEICWLWGRELPPGAQRRRALGERAALDGALELDLRTATHPEEECLVSGQNSRGAVWPLSEPVSGAWVRAWPKVRRPSVKGVRDSR